MPTSLAVLSLVVSLRLSPEDIEEGRAVFAASGIARAPIEATLAQGYLWAWGRWIRPSGLTGPMRPMPHGLTLFPTSGLIASAPDVARFSIELDQGGLLNQTTRALAWTAPLAPDGNPLPYGLGWFVQQHRGYKIVGRYGDGLESSSLLVKGTENNFQSGLIRFIVPMPSQSRSRDDAQSVPETHDLGPTAG
jgi:hypothetical protein